MVASAQGSQPTGVSSWLVCQQERKPKNVLGAVPIHLELAGRRKKSVAGGWNGGFSLQLFGGWAGHITLKQLLRLILAHTHFPVLLGSPEMRAHSALGVGMYVFLRSSTNLQCL